MVILFLQYLARLQIQVTLVCYGFCEKHLMCQTLIRVITVKNKKKHAHLFYNGVLKSENEFQIREVHRFSSLTC